KNPLDCWVYQEIIYRTRPDVLLELGVAFGGSGLYFADLMDSLDHGMVLGVDIDISRAADVQHPRIERLEGSSVAPEVVAEVWKRCAGKRVMVIADSDHRETHVHAELEAYCGLVSEGMYIIVEDTLADVMNAMPVPVGGPLPAVRRFLADHDDFELDMNLAEKYLLTQSPYGFLQRTKPQP
ncbi:MAG: cephalosporin hydroxylase, partial [Syntrophobacteraceae bacterium]|nr:cephalosporin hydroxylase [Syntrophobacteraceae bacterium]